MERTLCSDPSMGSDRVEELVTVSVYSTSPEELELELEASWKPWHLKEVWELEQGWEVDEVQAETARPKTFLTPIVEVFPSEMELNLKKGSTKVRRKDLIVTYFAGALPPSIA